jgi:hypothetical protein
LPIRVVLCSICEVAAVHQACGDDPQPGRGGRLRPVDVNGGPGALLLDRPQRLMKVWALDIYDRQITRDDTPL